MKRTPRSVDSFNLTMTMHSYNENKFPRLVNNAIDSVSPVVNGRKNSRYVSPHLRPTTFTDGNFAFKTKSKNGETQKELSRSLIAKKAREVSKVKQLVVC